MAYDAKYLKDINEIIADIELGRLDDEGGAKKKFESYLNEITNIGQYDKNDWNLSWRQGIYKFGRIFEKNDAAAFLDLIKEARKSYAEDKLEILEFIYSEIIWNYFDKQNEYNKDLFKNLIKKYPGNPEFHNSYSHFLGQNGNNLESIAEAKFALKIEKNNPIFKKNVFNKEKRWFNLLVNKRKIDEAEKVLVSMRGSLQDSDYVFNNMIVAMHDRLEDHKIIDKKIGDVGLIISKEISKERRRMIEILGIFVAILGFIFTNINIALNNLGIHDILLLMFGMAIVLIDFTVAISYLYPSVQNSSNNFWSFLGHKRFWALLASLVALFVIIQKV